MIKFVSLSFYIKIYGFSPDCIHTILLVQNYYTCTRKKWLKEETIPPFHCLGHTNGMRKSIP